MTESQGEIALVLEYNLVTDSVTVVSSRELGETYATADKGTKERMLAFEYTQACELPKNLARKIDMEKKRMRRAHTKIPGFTTEDLLGESEELVSVMVEGIVKRKGVVTKKKYKPVAKKVKPVVTELPGKYRIIREIKGDPLANMPVLGKVPPPFEPKGRYTAERREALGKAHEGFLWEEEIKLMDHFMGEQNQGFAWEVSERGRFRSDVFPPIEFPVVAHEPYIEKNIPIPPGIYEEVCRIIKSKIEAGVYEPSNAGYRT